MNKKDISLLFTNGNKRYGKIVKIIFLPGNGNIIISAPIKIFKRAVDRNKIKRLVRNSISDLDLSKIDTFIIYNIPKIVSFDEVKLDINTIFDKII